MELLQTQPYWYLRHGETDWNRKGLLQGRTDIPLNNNGIAQAESAGRLLARHHHEGAKPLTHIVSSPLQRAYKTATIVASIIKQEGGPELPVFVDDELVEVDFGVKEGDPMGEWYDEWVRGDFVLEGGELFAVMRDRVVGAVNRAMTRGSGLPLVVCHGVMFRGLRSAMGMAVNVRLPNAIPLYLAPPADKAGSAWSMTAFEG